MEAQYFAQIDENNIVIDIHCVTQEFIDANPDRYTGTWVETFIDRADKTYAGLNYIYNPSTENFSSPYPVIDEP
jgi:hypothetical protein